MAKSTPVRANPVPQTEEEAAFHAQEYVTKNETLKQLVAEEAQEIAEVQQKYADRKKPHIEARDEHLRLAHHWGEANRSGRKTISLPNGRKLEWRLPSSPTLIVMGDLETIVRLLMRAKDWSKYLKIELKKNNIKADLEELKQIRGLRSRLSLDKTEFFRIS